MAVPKKSNTLTERRFSALAHSVRAFGSAKVHRTFEKLCLTTRGTWGEEKPLWLNVTMQLDERPKGQTGRRMGHGEFIEATRKWSGHRNSYLGPVYLSYVPALPCQIWAFATA